MFKKFQNNSAHEICVIFQGKKVIIKPGQIISGPEKFLHYNGLVEVKIPGIHHNLENIQMSIQNINNQEVNRVIELVNTLDTSKPFSDYSKKASPSTFSIITLTNDKETYINFLNTLKNQETKYTFEIISLFNFNNEFTSCSQALNYGMSIANSEYYILCHHDLLCPNTWVQKYKDSFDLLDRNRAKVGFIGMAGTGKLGRHPSSEYAALYLEESMHPFTGKDITFATLHKQIHGLYKEVQCLDECVMACKASLGLKYDEINFDHYHFYGADICLTAISKGYKNFAVAAECNHLSNGQKNLSSEKHKNSYIEHGSRLHLKWRGLIPYFRTTTSSFYGPERIWFALIFQNVNKTYNTNYPIEIKVP